MIVPDGVRPLTKLAKDVIEICRVSVGQRAAAYRQYGQWIETGRASGSLALANMLYAHIDRLASHLFSPPDLRFAVDFENHYGPRELAMGEMAARVVSREWERRSIDNTFGSGVRESAAYGACILKQIVDWTIDERTGGRIYRNVGARLVMPWAFGVYNEAVNALDWRQEAVCETIYLSKPEVYRRVAHMPDGDRLYQRAVTTGGKNEGVAVPTSFMHQVLSTAVLDVSLANATTPQPGGIVQLSNDPNASTLGPQIAVDLIPMHELWIWDDTRDDWTTIQLIEPDILIAPRLKRTNLFCPGVLPYTLIQGNRVEGYFWGRSEIVDLMQLQQWLSSTMDDVKRIFGQQVDKLLAFPGFDGLTDELYAQFRAQGYLGMPPGSSVSDLTPKMPENAIQIIELILSMMDKVAGFPPILTGQGEPGVRAGSHADVLQRNASPRLRDRALLIERACAEAGDVTLSAMEAKNPEVFWTEPGKEEQSSFYLAQLPRDRRIVVDSHSTSPIYAEDHQNLVAFGLKAGIIDPISAIEQLNIPNKDMIIERLKQREAAQQKMIAELIAKDPQQATEALLGKRSHHKA